MELTLQRVRDGWADPLRELGARSGRSSDVGATLSVC